MTELGYNYVDSFVVWEKPLNDFEYTNNELYNQVCRDNITTDKDKYENYKELCLYFTKSMYYIDKESGSMHKRDNINEICAYLNYYLNRELKKINDSRENLEQFYEKMKTNNTSSSLSLNKCDDKIKKIEDNNLKDTEFLRDLFFNADKYIKNFDKSKDIQCSYAVECHNSYNERINECPKSSSNIFCQQMGKFKDRYKLYMSTNECGLPKDLPEFGKNPIARIPSGDAEDATSSYDFSNLLRGKIGTLAFTTPGIVIGLSVLYKFTPLGTRISQLFQRKNNIVQNIQEQNDDYPVFNSDNLHRNSSNSNYNITYQQY